MVKKGYTPEQIINKLREAEILVSQAEIIAVIGKKIGLSDYTYYRWRKEYGGMRVDQARQSNFPMPISPVMAALLQPCRGQSPVRPDFPPVFRSRRDILHPEYACP